MWYGLAGIWLRRVLISVPTAGATSADDVNVVIPADLDEFWDNIDTSADEIRVTDASGNLLTYKPTDAAFTGAFSKANRNGGIQINALTLPNVAGSCTLVYLYYLSSAAQGTAADTGATYSGTLTGYIDLSSPAQHVVVHQPPVRGQRRPRFSIVKRSAEYVSVFYGVSPALTQRVTPGYGANYHESPWWAYYQVLDTAGAAVGSMIDTTRLRWIWDGAAFWLICPVQAGTDETNYTIAPIVRTVRPGVSGVAQIIEGTAGLRVEDARYTS